LDGYVKVGKFNLFYTSRSAKQPLAYNDEYREKVITIYGWFCHSLDKSESTLVIFREVFIYENFIRRQENLTQICKIETECVIDNVVCLWTGP
jgi:hypothetical protein